MRTVNIHEAKTHLSRLLEDAVRGEPFIIAKSGKPLMMVSRIEPQEAKPQRRTGFLAGQVAVPDDFDQMGSDDIASLFEGKDA